MTDRHGSVELPVELPVESPVEVTGGVDTHKDFHVAAAKDGLGRVLGTQMFPATTAGYTALTAWLEQFGAVVAVGVEGTGSYGAGLARYLDARGVPVVEVNRPNRQKRRQKGKSDVQDAINAAAAVQAGDATAIPKAGTGPAAAVAALRTVRASAVKSRTVALNQLGSLLVTAPAELRETLTGLTSAALINHLTSQPTSHTLTALRRLAHRVQTLTEEIGDLDAELKPLLSALLPTTMALRGVGPDTAGQLLTTLADNPERITTDARFAHLCGAAPIEASSGNTQRHRLNRGGDRQANAALYRIVIVRLRYCERTKAYLTKRTAEGLSKREIIRCLKRYVARDVYHTLRTDLAAHNLDISA